MNVDNYIRGKTTPIYMLIKSDDCYLATDNFRRVFYFNKNNLVKVENSELVEELYNNLIYLENHKDDLNVQAEVRKNKLYNNFWSFVANETIKEAE